MSVLKQLIAKRTDVSTARDLRAGFFQNLVSRTLRISAGGLCEHTFSNEERDLIMVAVNKIFDARIDKEELIIEKVELLEKVLGGMK